MCVCVRHPYHYDYALQLLLEMNWGNVLALLLAHCRVKDSESSECHGGGHQVIPGASTTWKLPVLPVVSFMAHSGETCGVGHLPDHSETLNPEHLPNQIPSWNLSTQTNGWQAQNVQNHVTKAPDRLLLRRPFQGRLRLHDTI